MNKLQVLLHKLQVLLHKLQVLLHKEVLLQVLQLLGKLQVLHMLGKLQVLQLLGKLQVLHMLGKLQVPGGSLVISMLEPMLLLAEMHLSLQFLALVPLHVSLKTTDNHVY
jgi:hypothetical protein